jgi:hypothetical protein
MNQAPAIHRQIGAPALFIRVVRAVDGILALLVNATPCSRLPR